MNNLLKLLALFSVIISGFTACSSDSDSSLIEYMLLDTDVSNGLKLNVGDTYQLKITVSPASAQNIKIVWTSSNENVVKVDENGLLTAVSNGQSTITVVPSKGSAQPITFVVTVSSDRDFPDYEGGTTAYFAYQYPVRTLILGNDIYDNTLDNAHMCRIWSALGGSNSGCDGIVQIVIDNTLCDNLYFTDDAGNVADPVLPMPSSYYNLLSTSIPYNGDTRGYVEVQFTDAFFNDPKSISNTYVIPLVMKSVTGIDNILTGSPREGLTPSRTNTDDWDVLARDYVLYCVKYMNPWQGKYIRRGVDKVKENGYVTVITRKDMSLASMDSGQYSSNPVNANDEVCAISTINMKQALFPVTFKTSSGSVPCNLILTFDGNKCTISTEDQGITVTGTGEYIEKGTEMAEYSDFQWGSNNGEPVQRDILRLSYNVDFNSRIQVSTTDTLVVQTRESNQKVTFSPKYIRR